MKIRIQGTPDECEAIISGIKNANLGLIRSVSDWYANRGSKIEGRIYIEIDPNAKKGE